MVAIAATIGFSTSGDNRWDPQPTLREQMTVNPLPDSQKLTLWTPSMGIAAALADIQTLTPYDQPFVRYVFNPDGDMRTCRSVSYTINDWSRSSFIFLPTILAEGHLSRYDIRRYVKNPDDFEELEEVAGFLEDFKFDTNFSLDITKDMLELAERFGHPVPKKIVKRRREVVEWTEKKDQSVTHRGGDFHYPDDSGRVRKNMKAGEYTADLRFKTIKTEEYDEEQSPFLDDGAVVLQFPSSGVAIPDLVRLGLLAHSQAPIVSARYFCSRARDSLQTKNRVYDTVFGGRYFQLSGIKKSPNKGQTDQDFFFETFLGIGNFKGKLNARQLFDSIQSDHRYLVLKSKVAGHKNRIILDDPTLASYKGGMITLDIQDENVDVTGQAVLNLADGQLHFDAQEGLFPDSKKMVKKLLWNGDGALQEEAPFQVVAARNHPDPMTTRLTTKDCSSCHASRGDDMWLPFKNDALKFIGLKLGQADVFDAFHDPKRKANVVNRIAGQYAGENPSDRLRDLRMDHLIGTFNAVGGMFEGSDGSQADVGKLNAQWLDRMYARENYTSVGAKQAMEDLGLEEGTHYPFGKAKDTLDALLLPDLRNPPVNGFVVESGLVAVLRSGEEITPAQWFFLRPFVAERSRIGVEALRKAVQK